MAINDGLGDVHVANTKSLMPNMNFETGIHYGCISQHSLDPCVLDDLISDSSDLIYDESKDEFIDDLKDAVQEILNNNGIENVTSEDINFDVAINEWDETYMNDNHHYLYDDGEYELDFSDDLVSIIIKKSPYYTFCEGCSPCVPNAGNLDEPVTADDYEKDKKGLVYSLVKKAYCLPDDFFENNKAPYEYFEVKNE